MQEDIDRLKAALAGRYTIEDEVGRGGMATVYLALDEKHDRPKEKECDRVADAPERAVTDALRRRFGARRERRDRSDMVRLDSKQIGILFEAGIRSGGRYDRIQFTKFQVSDLPLEQ